MIQQTEAISTRREQELPAGDYRFAIVERTVEEAQQALEIQHKPEPVSRLPEIVQRPVRARFYAD